MKQEQTVDNVIKLIQECCNIDVGVDRNNI